MSDASSGDDPVPPSSIADPMPTPPGALPIRCPHCLGQTSLPKDQPLGDARCASCGSDLGLLGGAPREAASPLGSGATRGEHIAHFELLEKLGAGGFGEVWKARDSHLDRTVALKLPHRGRLSPEEREKFLREARAAAQLRHPDIVSVHEAGIDREYLYIVSDFIEGMPLDQWISRHRPLFRDTAALGVKIADALHHAHEEGVIHRDLKPSNIMIDGSGEPHLMDFGLARRLAGEVTMTMEGQILGTPAYMSPEQAQGSAHAADRRSDIYSLGVILFELLTGERPFRGNAPMLLKQVVEDDPPSPRKLDSRIPRDLETICLRCLQKEPARRYPMAKAVSEELTRYLSGMPIQARPVGNLERLGRWCRRNPLVATAGGVAVVCLLVALTATSLGYLWTSRALEETRRAQARAETSFLQARAAVDDLFTRVSEDTLLDQEGMQPLRRDLLRLARDYYEEFLAQSGGNPAVRDELALAHYRVGLITELVESPAQALASFQQARQMQQELVAQDPRNAGRLKALGDTLNAIGTSLYQQQRLDRALEAYAEAIEIRQRLVALAPGSKEFQRTLANSWMNTGVAEKDRNPARARECLEKSQAIREPLLAAGDDGKIRRDFAMGYFNLAALGMVTGDAALAEGSLEKAHRLFQGLAAKNPTDLKLPCQVATTCRLRGDLKCVQKQFDQAIALYGEARAALQPLAARNPTVAEYQVALAEIHITLAQAELERGRREAALAAFEQAEKILTPLVAAHSGTGRYCRDLIVTLHGVQQLDPSAARRQEVLTVLQTLRAKLAQSASEHPDIEGLRQQIQMLDAAMEEVRFGENPKPAAPPPVPASTEKRSNRQPP